MCKNNEESIPELIKYPNLQIKKPRKYQSGLKKNINTYALSCYGRNPKRKSEKHSMPESMTVTLIAGFSTTNNKPRKQNIHCMLSVY